MSSHNPRSRGFTIMEILIAVAILVVGLLGVLALFPVAINSGKITIQDTNAILIAQSVHQGIQEGLQHRKGQSSDGGTSFFVFEHDGLYRSTQEKDRLPSSLKDAEPSRDYYILLPGSRDAAASAVGRADAYNSGPVFIYPETDGKEWEIATVGGGTEIFADDGGVPNGGGDTRRADDDKDDWQDEELERPQPVVRATYRVSSTTLPLELEAEELEGPRRSLDPFNDYSFAFAIRRAFNDASLQDQMPTDNRVVPADELYEVRIMVFRNFQAGTTNADPIYTTSVLVHK